MKKDATWLPYIRLKPEPNPQIVNEMSDLRQKNNIDELLRVKYRFFSVTTPEVTSRKPSFIL